MKSGRTKSVRWSFVFAAFLLTLTPQTVLALNNAREEEFAAYDIMFYDPEDNGGCGGASAPVSGGTSPVSGAAYERLKDAVRQYGEHAMEMQRMYGTPWEVVFAQMQVESGTGTAGHAVEGATNNWLGITGTGDAGAYTSPGGRKWAIYSSVEASISDWAGPRVLRNGYYDAAFAYLDPNSYSMEQFLSAMISVYAPGSDGNNVPVYVANVLSLVNGPIAEVRTEMGWPSSAELAEQESIPVGGQNPIGSTVANVTGSVAGTCFGLGANASVTEAAIAFSWPGIRSHALDDPTPAYREALSAVGLNNYGDSNVNIGASCDAFVATVYRSTVDPGFQCCGTINQLSYLHNSSSYVEIENLGNTSNLESGDILILDRNWNYGTSGHIMLFIVENGTPMLAHASYGDRTGERGGNPYFSDSRGKYRVYRFIGGA
jgi:hypothetical protein